MRSVQSIFASLPSLTQSAWPQRPNVSIIRGDLLHPVVSGNKLYKLQPLLEAAQDSALQTLISVGGRYSNHLHALAWASREAGLQSVGLVLGYAAQVLTPTLLDCQRWGMELHFVDRQTYQERYTDGFWQPWLSLYPNSMRVNEGGWSAEGIKGSGLWWQGIDPDTDLVVCAVGSGSTLAGLATHAPAKVSVVGVPVFRDADNYQDLQTKMAALSLGSEQYSLWTDFAGPGFGKLSPAQRTFSQQFSLASGIALDPVYTAKVFYALESQLTVDPHLHNRKIAILHTGGLQGCRQ
ncbi:pyridoxal-phosphate dependent enzyme [Reinekea sp.]|uniref:1-aminocyclopropane-1-carboxylate deaminase/D-cysteine desulfhydrase n=1 Tax=Reinekea sp. TaxID=1970455 RepID=UPI00257EBB6A|nr:pyridoxal-phosphate dependent enzyme [Reinekea sp.]MDO7641446.1 pyridoxal-phosphate dependent enzyme [Reinekea forsetii]